MKRKAIAAFFLAAVLVLSLAGCASKSESDSGYVRDELYSEGNGSIEFGAVSDSSGSTVLSENRKLVKTVSMETETEDMDTLLEALNRKVSELEGYVEQRNVYNGSAYGGGDSRYASLVIRIPAARLSEFTTEVSQVSNVVNQREEIDDITLAYVDTEGRLEALKAERKRLMELLEKAETMSDLLEIESRLTEVNYELESVASQLRVYDNQVDYATVNLNIDEVRKLTPVAKQSVWQRMGSGFLENLKDLGNGLVELLVLLVAGLPYLVLIAALAAVIVLLVRRGAKRKKGKKPPFETGNPGTPEEPK